MLIRETSVNDLTASGKETLAYFRMLSSAASVDAGDLPIEFLEMRPDERGLMNKAFSDWLDKTNEEREAKKKENISKASRYAKDLADQTHRQLLDRIMSDMDTFKRAINVNERQIQLNLSSLHRKRLELDTLENRPNVVEEYQKELTSVFTNPFFKEHIRSGELIILYTTNPIILNQKNKKSGVDISVNMGSYKVNLNMREASLSVHPWLDNVYSPGEPYYHPYVNSGGNICWGNADSTAHDLLANRKFGQALELLSALLTTYDPTSTPYAELYRFDNARKDAQGRPRINRPPDEDVCEICEDTVDACDCHHCEACDVRYADGDSCDGQYCEACEECVGNQSCEIHHCAICGDDTLENNVCSAGCCKDCECSECECDPDGEEATFVGAIPPPVNFDWTVGLVTDPSPETTASTNDAPTTEEIPF